MGIQLRISDLLFAVQKRWKIIVALTFMGLVFGLLLSGMNYVQSAVEDYQIDGSLLVSAVDSDGRYSGNNRAPSRTDITMATEMYDTVYYLLRSDRLLYQVINDEQLLGVSASDIRGRLSISQYGDTNIITMRLTWDHGEEGLTLWNDIVSTANRLLAELVQVGRLNIFNEPVAKLINSRTANIKTWMILPVLGFAAGMGFAIIELMMRPTLINVKDIEPVFGLETIGIIPHDSSYFKGRTSLLVSDEKASTDVSQSFSAAAYILRNRIGSKEKCHCFYITSTTGEEGRTSIAASLAIELSDMEKRTLLIDFDYKNPMLGSLFLNNIDYNRSLNALYRGEVTMADAITTLTGYLDLLPMVMEHNLIYLDSTIVEMITQLKEQYDYIIIDAPPVGKESETLSLNQVANTVVFVIRYDTAPIPEIQAALEKLDKSGTRVLGCIVNAVQTSKNVMMGVGKKGASKNEAAPGKKKTSSKKKKKKGPKAEKTQAEKQEKKENDAALLTLINKQKAAEAAGRTEDMDMDLPPSMREVPASAEAPEAAQAPQEAPFVPSPSDLEDWPLPSTSTPAEEEQPEQAEQTQQPEQVKQSEQAESAASLPAPEIISPEEGQPQAPVSEPAGAEQTDSAEDAVSLPAPEIISPEEWAQASENTEGILSQPEDTAAPGKQAAPPETPQKKRGMFGFLFKGSAPKAEKSAKAEKPGKTEKPKAQKPAKAEKPKAAPVKENAPGEVKAQSQPAKKKKAGGGFWALGIEKKPKTPQPLTDIKPEATVIKASRNVFDDLMDDVAADEPLIKSDAEITEELVRMGLDGSWDQPESKETGSAPSAPGQNGKK